MDKKTIGYKNKVLQIGGWNMEKELIKALEKLEKLVTDGIIESYELHRDKKTFNSYVSVIGSLKDWGSCEVSAWLYEIDDIPQVIKNKLMF